MVNIDTEPKVRSENHIINNMSDTNDIIRERDKYKQEAEDYKKELQAIINGCVHPDEATRRVILDLVPIRAVLKKYSN